MNNKSSPLARSPCISICLLDDNDICSGCFRSVKEITYWGTFDEAAKIAVNQQALERSKLASNKL